MRGQQVEEAEMLAQVRFQQEQEAFNQVAQAQTEVNDLYQRMTQLQNELSSHQRQLHDAWGKLGFLLG